MQSLQKEHCRVCMHTYVGLALDYFDTEDTKVDTVAALVVLVVEILVVAVTLMVGISLILFLS